MIDFFIALIGGTYLFGKYKFDKGQRRRRDAETQKWIDEMTRDLDEWVAKVVDHKAEYLAKRDTDKRYAMQRKLEHQFDGMVITYDMVIMAILAQEAKIPEQIATHGIRSRGFWSYEETLKWYEQRRFLLWYDEELRKNGIKEKLLLVSRADAQNIIHDKSLAKPIAECGRQFGIYFWMPIRRNVTV